MRLKRFNEKVEDEIIYNDNFQDLLPNKLTVSDNGRETTYTKGNIMKHSDMLQIVYSSDEIGIPGDLELDLYFVQNGGLKIDVDITYGDLMVFEFSLERPNKVHLIEKYSDFKFKNDSLKSLIPFFNQLNFKLLIEDFHDINIIY